MRRILIEFNQQSSISIFISELSDTIMNVVGSLMWLAVGGTALHYWQGYMAAYDQVVVVQEQVVIFDFSLLLVCLSEWNNSTRLLTILFSIWPGRFGAWIIVRSVGGLVRYRHGTSVHSFRQVEDSTHSFRGGRDALSAL